MRLVVGLAGLLTAAAGLAMTATILGDVLASPWDIDLPGGPVGPVILAILTGGAPIALGTFLVRKAVRAGRESAAADPVPLPGGRFVQEVSADGSPAQSGWAGGALLRSSIGLALATAAVTIPLMLIWRFAAPLTAVTGLSAFSLVDPLLNLQRRSWWLGAALSASTWMALLLTLAATADTIEPMREGAMIFMLPMMIYGGAMSLSAVARLVIWTKRRSARRAA